MLKVSISGVRGLWSKDLTPNKITSYTRAFLEVSHKGSSQERDSIKIVVGGDTRPSSAPFRALVCALLQRWGVEVIDLGVIATPLLLFSVRKLKAQGGIVITASHNPVEWNAFKLVNEEGLFFDEKEMDALVLAESNYNHLPSLSEKLGTLTPDASLIDQYFDFVLPYFPLAIIKDSKIKIVADVVNGTASSTFPLMMQSLGLEYSLLHQDTTKTFERGAEPRAENLTELSKKVVMYKAHAGFAFDPDGDRLALVNEKGEVMGENWTLAMAYLCFLKYHHPTKKDIVVNLSTSLLIEEIAKKNQAQVKRTPVGEINVTQELLREKLSIGGEGNGGVIFPSLNPCRDSFIACLFILEYMARENRSLSSIQKEFPIFHSLSLSVPLKKSLSWEDISTKLTPILESFSLPIEHIDTSDGLRIDYPSGWIQVRTSNTEPILRIMGESLDEEKQKSLGEKLIKTFSY